MREADQLRLACAEALCTTQKRRADFREAVEQLKNEGEELNSYCRQMSSPSFWGGIPEIMTLAKMLKVPIYVYISREEQGTGSGYVPLTKHGEKFSKPSKDGSKKGRKPVRLLFTGGNHYDLLLK